MVTEKLGEAVNNERGSAFLLVLIALALGSIIIMPTVNYVRTGLIDSEISAEDMVEQYAADAAAEYALWQLSYSEVADELSMENPTSNTTVTINDIEIPIITSISHSPESDEGSFTIPDISPGISISVATDIRPTTWIGAGQKSFMTHVIYIYNSGTATTHLKGVFQSLDPCLRYVEQSYTGPEATLTKSWVTDHWELYWEFDEPLPGLSMGDINVVTFNTWSQQDMGEYTFTGEGYVEYAAFQEDQTTSFSGESGVASFGLYDVIVTVGSYTIQINVGITEEGEVVIRSWQIL